MWFHLLRYSRNPFNPSNQVWWILNCGKSMKEKLSWMATPCLIKCSRFLRLCLESRGLNGEPEGNQCVLSAQKPRGQKEKDPANWSFLITEGTPPPISSIARIKSTHGSTRLCIISTQKQTLGLTIGASEPVLTLSPGNHGKAAQRGKSLRICLLPKGRVGWHSFTSVPPETGCLMKPSFTRSMAQWPEAASPGARE